jgi:hypothetical protein
MDVRKVRRDVDDLFRANKTRQFTMAEISSVVGVPVQSLIEVLDWVSRCPFTACQSFDTDLTEESFEDFQVHHCNRCNRNFHLLRQPDGEFVPIGWYGE